MAESSQLQQRGNDQEKEQAEDDDALRLRRETEVPHYTPQQGTGASVLDGPGTQGSVISTTNTPLKGAGATAGAKAVQAAAIVPSNKQNGAGYFPPYASPNEVDRDASSKSQQYGQTYLSHESAGDAPLSTAGLSTPSSGFGYSPSTFSPYPSGSGPAGSASVATVNGASPDWLPSPVVEEREDDARSNGGSAVDGSLSRGIEDLAMQGIQVVPSSSKPKAAVAPEAKAAVAQPAANHQTSPLKTVVQPASSNPSPTPSRASSVAPAQSHGHAAARPAMPEQKKSILGKLFHHNKDKEHHKNGDHSADSSARASPVPSMQSQPEHSGLSASRPSTANKDTKASSRERANSASASAYTSGAESDSGTHVSAMSRNPSTTREKEGGGGGFSSFLGRRSSNKKMEKPDPTLVAMTKNASLANKSAISMETSPNASSTTVSTPGLPTGAASTPHPALGASSLAVPGQSANAQASSIPESTFSKDRTASPSPARHPSDTKATGSSMFRRPSGGAASLTEGHRNGVSSGTATPATDERHQVKEKSLKEHLAALGSSSMMGKLHRKSSQTSRKSDDGKSDRSHHDEPGHHTADSAHGHVAPPPQPKRAPSVAGSNASTSLLQKYGVCEKVAIGKGATAVVRLAHKWDRSSEKLYAVKEFRKRRKNETEKEYVKKLTSEFCISSTLHHINVVETVDLVQNEEKHWCEVMEYCPGGDLYAAIKKGDMTTAIMNNYFKQIITGVAYLHSMGVAHRDIKPENLLLDGRGHLKITDFGVSDVFRMCWEKQTHMSKGLCGSEPYIAPEQFEQKEYDARLVDVWACAVVFYCMQAQELPWRVAKPSDPSFQEYIELYARSPSPQPLGNLHPKECRSIVKKMLDPNPKTRIGSDAVLADPWMKAIDYNVLPTDPATPLP